MRHSEAPKWRMAAQKTRLIRLTGYGLIEFKIKEILFMDYQLNDLADSIEKEKYNPESILEILEQIKTLIDKEDVPLYSEIPINLLCLF